MMTFSPLALEITLGLLPLRVPVKLDLLELKCTRQTTKLLFQQHHLLTGVPTGIQGSCSSDANGGGAVAITVVVTNGGTVDVTFAQSEAEDGSGQNLEYLYFAVFAGNIPSTTLFVAEQDACTATGLGTTFMFGGYTDDLAKTIAGVQLAAGTYTIVLSSYNTEEYSTVGVFVDETRIADMITAPGWVQPERSQDGNACVSTGDDASGWYSKSLVASGSVVLIDTQSVDSDSGYDYIDTYSWLFRGNQTAVPPPTCGGAIITAGDTGDVTPVYGVTRPGNSYTCVVSTYSSGNTNDGQSLLWLMAGSPIGYVPPSGESAPTAPTSTPTGTPGSAPTGTPGSAPTGTPGSAPTGTPSTPSTPSSSPSPKAPSSPTAPSGSATLSVALLALVLALLF